MADAEIAGQLPGLRLHDVGDGLGMLWIAVRLGEAEAMGDGFV